MDIIIIIVVVIIKVLVIVRQGQHGFVDRICYTLVKVRVYSGTRRCAVVKIVVVHGIVVVGRRKATSGKRRAKRSRLQKPCRFDDRGGSPTSSADHVGQCRYKRALFKSTVQENSAAAKSMGLMRCRQSTAS